MQVSGGVGHRQGFDDPVARALVEALREAAGERLIAVLLFGSRLVGAAPGRHSAYDLVVVTDDYRSFYERLHETGHHGRGPRLMTALSRVLAPNLVAFEPGLPGGEIAKMMVLTPADLARALSGRARDHFLKGRLVQKVVVLHARTPDLRRDVERLLADARADVLRWTGPWLEGPFTTEELVRRMLEVSYAAEIRPEAAGRVEAVFEAQRKDLVPAYEEVLCRAAREGVVERRGRGWQLPRRPAGLERLRWRLYFLRSKLRATSRWLKHVVTFDDWLTYIQRKVERRTGMRVEVTPMERKLPLVLLWPKAIRVLRELRRQGTADEAREPRDGR